MTPFPPGLSHRRPFPGLRPFDFDDHEFFFGREDQIFSLYRLVERNRFVVVVGSSGSGKSSLVRAGLHPLLELETKGTGGRIWHWKEMRPSTAPLERLARALTELSNDADPVIALERENRIGYHLRRSSFGIVDSLNEVEGLGSDTLVLIVDQFEELFRYAGSGVPERRDK